MKVLLFCIALTITSFILFGCNASKKCSSIKDIIGSYRSIGEPAIHSIQINYDGIYVHTYESIDSTIVNRGHWNFDKKECKIIFSDWKSFGKYKEEECASGCTYSVDIKQNKLIFNFDLDEMNFIK